MTIPPAPVANTIAAIIVNYRTADLTASAVESLLSRDHTGYHLDIHIVDNASPDGDRDKLRRFHAERGWGDSVIFWLEQENHGFGRGNNVVLTALSASKDPPDKVFLLNPDARLHNEAVRILAQAIDGDPQAAGAGASILRPDLTRTAAAFRFPSFLGELARVVQLDVVNRLLHRSLLALSPDHPKDVVNWVSGAAVMFRMKALRDVDFFDPGFFLYYEEVDLMRRLDEAGWHMLYVPEAEVIHEEGASTGQFASQSGRQRDPAYLYQSYERYFRHAFGRGRALALALVLWPAAAVNVLHRKLRGRPPHAPLGFFQDHWRHVVRPLLTKGGDT